MYNHKETILRAHMKKYLIASVSIIFVISAYFLIHSFTKKTLLLKCYGNALTVRYDSQQTEIKVTTTSSIFLYSDGKGIFTQIGNVEVGKAKYVIDRTHSVNYSDSDGDGVYSLELKNTVKRTTDNFPDNVPVPYNTLRNSSVPLYISITKPDNDLYLFKESNTPWFFCKRG